MNNESKNKNRASEGQKNRNNAIIVALIVAVSSIIGAIVGGSVINVYINTQLAIETSVAATITALIPTETLTPINSTTFTITPSLTFTSTSTLAPTNTNTLTFTPAPTNTFTPEPTNTPRPTSTSEPTNTPRPTRTPELPNIFIPTRTPEQPNTPRPTRTPETIDIPRPTRTPEPTPQGLNGIIEENGLEIRIDDYSFTTRSSDDQAAIIFSLTFTNVGETEMEVRFSESDLEGMSDDNDSYTDFVTSMSNYIDNSSCIYIGEWNFPDSDITLFIEPNDSIVHEFYLHRDDAELEERCPDSSAQYISRVSIGTNWVDVELPIEYQLRGSSTNRLNIIWRLDRND